MRKYQFKDVVDFKNTIKTEEKRFVKAFTGHLLRYALSRKLMASDSVTIEDIVNRSEKDQYRIQTLIKEIILSKPFLGIKDKSGN